MALRCRSLQLEKALESHVGFVTKNVTHIENTQDASCMTMATYTSYISYMWLLLLDWLIFHDDGCQTKIFEKWRLKSKSSLQLPLSLDVLWGSSLIFRLLDESQDSLDKLWQGLIKHQLLFHGICSCQVLKAFQRAIWDEGLMSWLPQIWRDFAMHHLGIRVSFSMKLPVVVIPNMDLSAKFVSYASLKLEFKQP